MGYQAYCRQLARLVVFALVLSASSCGLKAAVLPSEPPANQPDTFIEVMRIVEGSYWDADKLNLPPLLKGAVEGMDADLRRRGGNISYNGSKFVISLRGSTKTLDSSAIHTTAEFINAFADIYSFVVQHQATTSEAISWEYRAIEGMIKALDQHSAFMPPATFREMQEETRGSFGGLGIRIGLEGSEIVILEPIEGTPASRAGLKRGDRIVKIDGQPTQGLTLQEAVRRMRGPVGSRVALGIQRRGSAEPQEFSLTRAKIEIKTVESRVLEERIGYLKIRGFQERTNQEVERVLNRLAQQKVEGLIVDLRNNPGGLLSQAVKVCNLFMDEGLLVVSTEGRVRNQTARFMATSNGVFRQYPLIVLINSGSASGSEIVAGALQDLHKATIIGTKSFGKGSVQTIFPLHDGSGLRLTTAHYFTPSGRRIDRVGVVPDIEVRNEGQEDRQLSIAQEIFKEVFFMASRRKSPHGREALPLDTNIITQVGRAMLATPQLEE
jgi:carboxyl-terminal processing protease